MNLIFLLLVHVCLVVFSAGDQCQLLDGLWYGEDGSLLVLQEAKDGTLLGNYRTAEGELDIDSESNEFVDIAGVAQYNQSGAVFSLSAMWMDGTYIKVWSGQCLMYGSAEVLRTMWQLRAKSAYCPKQISTTSIGEAVFKRQRSEDDGKNVVNNQHHSDIRRLRRRSAQETDSARSRPQGSCSLLGIWYNQLGSQINITYYHDKKIRGQYQSPVGLDLSANVGNVYGMGNDLDASSTIAFYVAWERVGSATGWAGQCHLCGLNQTETLSTTWLLRTHASSDHDNWSSTLVGFDYFTRQKQTPGPRK